MITYRLMLSIYDTESATSHEAIYRNTAALDVPTLRSVDDRQAVDGLAKILLNELVPEGSTVLEQRELAAGPSQSVE